MTVQAEPVEPARGLGKVAAFGRLVVIEHSVFALPFAYIAAFTAMVAVGGSVRWWDLLLVTVAMVAARTVAMAANRIIDRRFDALNPRTARRELVTGALSVRSAVAGLVVALAVFFTACALLNPLCLLLSPIALFLLVIYSYGKRFTDFPQVLLGLAQFVAPLGAWLAVTGQFSSPSALPAVLLGVAVGAWIGGFDLIYACQDVEVDRRTGVRSVPVRFGIAGSLRASTVVHAITVVLFALFGWTAGLGWLWYAGVVVVAAVLAYEHAIVRPDDLSKVNRAFFTANGVVGIVLFVFGLADLVFLQGLSA